jgi:dTDP-4-dehydrorhamnose 3,5-epimerase
MKFVETSLPGAYIIELELRQDHRGFFSRLWDVQEFRRRGLMDRIVQANLSFNRRKGTLRGMHYQVEPYAEAKLVRCSTGAVYDVIVDLRPAAPTYGRWFGVELTASSYRMLYVPEGCAHGFLTLEDSTEVLYHVSQPYTPEAERGVRFDDPAFGITWPARVTVISEKDRSWPDFRPLQP